MNMSALLRQFSIRIRMIGAIAMVLALLCILGGFGLYGISSLREQSQTYVDRSAKASTELGDISHALSDPALQAKVAELQTQLTSGAKQLQQEGTDAYDHVLAGFVTLLVLSAVIVIPLTLLNMQSICKPLAQAEALARAIAQGDLTNASGEIEGQDEASHLLRSLQHMQGGLQTLVSQLRASADHIRTASVEIASGNQDLSNRTEQTAGNLQKAASSMVQLTGTVRQTADSALTANQLASSASSAAAKGGSVVDQVVSTMDEINVSSKRINDIIGVIDGIAFQTNILALNAAVEAARAGEQG
ncbi:MAG: HAMP domain-containing protein, partial [Paucibacter sp.]|nr:HAMP domain-containing protein [Roseateles sp.]